MGRNQSEEIDAIGTNNMETGASYLCTTGTSNTLQDASPHSPNKQCC